MAYGDGLSTSERREGPYPVVGSGGVSGSHDKANFQGPAIVIGRKGSYGSIHWIPADGFAIDTAYYIDSTLSSTHLRWLYYALQAVDLKGTSQDVGVPGLSREIAYSVLLPEPPSGEEQRRIADFLDAETSRIDRLLTYRDQQLKLLEERYWSTMRTIVTGTRSAIDSQAAIPWLGNYNPSWAAGTIGKFSRFTMGTTFPHAYQGESKGDFPFIKVGDFRHSDNNLRLDTADNWINTEVARKLGARIVPPGSVLYARVGAALLLNRRLIITRPSVIDDNVRAITFDDGVPQYWCSLLTLLDMGQLVNPGPVPSISESQVSSIPVPKPPADTQQEIARNIECFREKTSALKKAIRSQATLLGERRQALITAAVTGQFDVSTASGRNTTQGV